MAGKTFGFGIIGTGIIAGIHAQAIAAIPNASIRGVYSRTKSKSAAFAAKYNCASHDTLEQLLADQQIDIVCICTPSGDHQDPSLACIKAGKHVVIEKPLEVTLQKCDAIIESADKENIKAAVIFPSRFYDAAQRIKTAMESKRFGDIVMADAYVKWSRTPEYYASAAWRGTWALDGGGALMNQGIHSVDLVQWYMGKVKSVQAMTANIKHKGIEVEDSVVANVLFESGALGVIQCSTAVYPGAFKRIEILGTDGTAVMEEADIIKWDFRDSSKDADSLQKGGVGSSSAGGVSDPAAISFYGHQKQLEDMIDAISLDRKPIIDAEEGRKSVEIVLAIYESARTGRRVEL